MGKIQELRKAYEAKSTSKRLFHFVGNPIPEKVETIAKGDYKVHESKEPSGNIISDIKGQHIKSVSDQVLIKDVEGCILDIKSKSINFNIGKGCVMRLASEGSLFIHNLEDSVLKVECQQLRLHGVRRCTLICNIKSCIIEECYALKFKPESNFKIDDFSFPTKLEANPNYYIVDTVSEYSHYFETPIGLLEGSLPLLTD